MINYNESKDENEKKDHIDVTKITLGLDKDADIINTNCVSVLQWLYVLRNTKATFSAQLMKMLTNTEAKLKKELLIKKPRVFAVFVQTLNKI